MTPQQKRKADQQAAIVGYLKAVGVRLTVIDLECELSALNISMPTLRKDLSELVRKHEINFVFEQRFGSGGVPKMRYAYGPDMSSRQTREWPPEKFSSSQCNWLKANEWQRGQHGMDCMVSALFGEVRP